MQDQKNKSQPIPAGVGGYVASAPWPPENISLTLQSRQETQITRASINSPPSHPHQTNAGRAQKKPHTPFLLVTAVPRTVLPLSTMESQHNAPGARAPRAPEAQQPKRRSGSSPHPSTDETRQQTPDAHQLQPETKAQATERARGGGNGSVLEA